jgi:hypothetical protein
MPTYKNETSSMINTPFEYNNRKWLEPNEEAAVDYFLTPAEVTALGLTKTADTPYYKLSEAFQTNTFVGAGSHNFTNLKDLPILRVTTTVDIVMKANNVANTSTYPVAANDSIDIKNERVIDILIVDAVGAGTVNVIGLKS